MRCCYIEKSDGGQRGLGITSFEGNVAQRAVLMLLGPIYEQNLVDGSCGFRPGAARPGAEGQMLGAGCAPWSSKSGMSSGSLQRPLSDHDLKIKFRDLAEGVLSTENIDRIVACLWGIESLEVSGSIARFAQGRSH